MDKFIEEITSFYWWVGVVLVGIVINVISAYLKKNLDSTLSSISMRWRLHSEKVTNERNKLLDTLRSDGHKQLIYLANEQRFRARAIANLLASILSCSSGAFLYLAVDFYYLASAMFLFAAIVLLFALDDQRLAVRIKNNMNEIHEDISFR